MKEGRTCRGSWETGLERPIGEDRACEVTDELARWLMAEHIALDPSGPSGVEADCPLCGGPVRYESAAQAQVEVREFQTRRGKIEYRCAAARCRRCRKALSPLDGRLRPAA